MTKKMRKMITRMKILATKFNNNRMQNEALELLAVVAEVFNMKVVVGLVNEALKTNRIVSDNIKKRRQKTLKREKIKSKKTLKIMLLLANPLC